MSTIVKGSAFDKSRSYLTLCIEHYKRNWKAYTLPLVAVFILQLFVRIDVNVTNSLPDHLFMTIKGWKGEIDNGDYVVFEWQGGGPFPAGFHFLKRVGGIPGDMVSMDENRAFWINGNYQGTAKTISKKGEALEPGPTGVIPPAHFYVSAPHPDSLDSRYAMTGWISKDRIIGKAYPLF